MIRFRVRKARSGGFIAASDRLGLVIHGDDEKELMSIAAEAINLALREYEECGELPRIVRELSESGIEVGVQSEGPFKYTIEFELVDADT